jgi:anti-anti-sigma factor
MASELVRTLPGPQAVEEVIAVHFTGSKVCLDEQALTGVRDELYPLAEEMTESQLLLDCGNVDFLGSEALGVLLTLHKKLLARGRRFTVHGLAPELYEVFTATRLHQFLDVRTAEAEDGPDGPPPGVLVVDDETAVLCVAAAHLRRDGLRVWWAGRGPQAVELYRRHLGEIDVVLLDVLMPEMDGPHTLAALQALHPAVRCCFMTGNPEPYTEEVLLQMGALRVFQKPFAFAEVSAALRELARPAAPLRRDRWIELPRRGR